MHFIKVRHDGYMLQDFFLDQQQAFKKPFDQTVADFFNFFTDGDGKGDYDIDTNFDDGFQCTLSEKEQKINDPYELVRVMEDKIEKYMESPNNLKGLINAYEYEGFLFGYGDYCIILDFNTKKIYGFADDDGNSVIYDANFKQVS